MCWEVSIIVNLQKDTPANRAALAMPEIPGIDIAGGYPKFELRKNGCGCGLVQDARGKIEGLIPAVAFFLSQPVVKSVEVLWFWLSESPRDPPTEKIELGSFRKRADCSELMRDTVCRVYRERRG